MKKLLFIALGWALIGSTAFAHTHLVSSTPADKSVVKAAPETITLHFHDPVRLTSLKLQKDGGEAQAVTPLPDTTSTEIKVAAPPMGAGTYRVAWRAFSADGHVMEGSWTFRVTQDGAE